jgi:predicted DNA-binding transcriptional regulator YafY
VIQTLYREGLITQADAAKMGPKSPTPERAAKVAEARQAVEAIDSKQDPAEFRKAAKQTIRQALGQPLPTPLETAQRAYARLSDCERQAFARWLQEQPS